MTAQSLKDISNAKFDPFMDERFAYGSIADPYPIMRAQRAKASVTEGEYRTFFGADPDPALRDWRHYTVWSYDAVTTALSDPELFSSAILHKINVEPAFGRILVVMDPPEHTQYRRFLQTLFSPRAVKGWTTTVIRPLIHKLIDDFAADGEAELVERFTRRFPFEAVFQLLDLPEQELHLFHKLAVTQLFAITEFAADAIEAGNNLAEYLNGLCAERRRAPKDDLISQLATLEIAGERLPDEIVVGFVRHILNASADTSYRTTGSLLVALLSDPVLLAEVKANRALVPLAIEEALRWEGPSNINMRTLTRDIELDGVAMKAPAAIHISHSSANHDETRFPDPERFDLHRSRKYRHFGFGGGPHTCLGMALARAQILEAVNALLDRLPNLRLDPDAPPPVIEGFMFRKPAEVRVRFDPTRMLAAT